MNTIKSTAKLPDGYKAIYTVDHRKNKKAALTVNILAIAITALLVIPILFLRPISSLFDMSAGMAAYILRFSALLLLQLAYLVLHELVHGIAMKICGTGKVKYGFTGMYAFAGSDAYYCRKHYIMIALAPIVVWGIVLGIVNVLVPQDWFYVVYMIQMTNISGAAGDLYVSWKMKRLPEDILIQDSGVAMTVYSAEG